MIYEQCAKQFHLIRLTGFAHPFENVPSISKTNCPTFEKWDECYSIDFAGTKHDDMILTRYFHSLTIQIGHLAKDPSGTKAWVIRDAPTEPTLRVNLYTC